MIKQCLAAATMMAAMGSTALAEEGIGGPWAGPDAEKQLQRGQELLQQMQAQLEGMPRNIELQFETRKEKAAYLGLTTSPPNATLREQLKLPKGIGLVVAFLDKDAPAAAAGLAQHDVLTKLDDQWLVNLPQLATLVRMHKPGDTVKLTYIRAGETKTVDVKLVEKEVPVLEEEGGMRFNGLPPGFPGLPGQRGELTIPPLELRGAPPWIPAGQASVKIENGVVTRTLTDGNQTLVLKVDKDGTRTLSVENVKDHEVLFSGPIDTEEQRKKLPAGVADKLKGLENDQVGGVRVQIGGGNALGGPGIMILGDGGGKVRGAMSLARSDGQHTLKLDIDQDGNKHLLAKGKDGTVIYDGPINTAEERKKVPEDVLKKVEKMEGKARGE